MGSGYQAHRHVIESPLFRGTSLRAGERALLESVGFVAKHYPPHTDITRQGDTDDRTFIVSSGWGCLYKILPDGERQIIDFPLGGDVIGLRGGRAPSQNSFMSLTGLAVYEVDARTLIAAITHSEQLTEFFLAAESRHKAILAEHLTNLGHRGALSRTAHLLLELGARLEAVGCAGGDGFDCPLTQYDLADALGLTAIHVNRMLRELRERDLLSFNKGKVIFIDRISANNLSGFDINFLNR